MLLRAAALAGLLASSLALRAGIVSRARSVAPASSKLLDTDSALTEEVRRWHLLTQRTRADDVFVSRNKLLDATVDLWKLVLISVRVMERDEATAAHTAVVAFPKIIASEQNAQQLRRLAGVVESSLSSNSRIFFPNQARRLTVLPLESGYLSCSVTTRRDKPVAISYDDLDSYVPPEHKILGNDIPGFPFDTVYDFVAEIK